jgi:hypothetical protein
MLSALAVTLGANTLVENGSISLTSTNWSSSISIPQFNSSLGTLTSITFQLTGTSQGDVKFENKDWDNPATVSTSISSTVTLQRPDNSSLVIIVPTGATGADSLTAFDGTLDYLGSSGKTYTGVSGSSDNGTGLFDTTAADFILFTGPGNIVLPITAVGGRSVSGIPSNWAIFANQQASAGATITYDYVPEGVPEPNLMLLSGSGLLALGLLGRRRLAKRS